MARIQVMHGCCQHTSPAAMVMTDRIMIDIVDIIDNRLVVTMSIPQVLTIRVHLSQQESQVFLSEHGICNSFHYYHQLGMCTDDQVHVTCTDSSLAKLCVSKVNH